MRPKWVLVCLETELEKVSGSNPDVATKNLFELKAASKKRPGTHAPRHFTVAGSKEKLLTADSDGFESVGCL